MANLSIRCPSCEKSMSVPAEAVGKRIRCKSCSHVFTVMSDDDSDDGTPKPKKPIAAKPIAARPLPAEFRKQTPVAKPAEAAPKPAEPPSPFASDDDDDGPAQYGLGADETEKAICPRCAKELDPPDTKICLNCGFDLVKRVRHSTKKVYAQTTSDIIMYWLPAVIWIIVLLNVFGMVIYGWLNMKGIWTENGFLLSDDKNKLTDQKQFLIDPNACNVCCSVIFLAMMGMGVPVIYKRIRQPKPTEIEKRK